MHLLRVIGIHAKIGILKDLQYRGHFVANCFNSVAGLALAIGTILIVFRHTERLGDWNQSELIMLIGVYSAVRGFINFFIKPGLQEFLEGIRTGLFDYALLKPLDSQLYVAIKEFRFWSLIDLLTGVGIVCWSFWSGDLATSSINWFLVILSVAAGFAVVIAFWFILGTTAFWFIKLENIFVVFETLFQTARWPLTIYPEVIRTLLTVVIPVAWAVTMPAAALASKTDSRTIGVAILVPVFFVGSSRLLWRFGVSRYSGASA